MDKKTKRDAAVQALLDKQEIRELLMRYCRAIDRCDEPLLRSVYHPDATDAHGGQFSGKASDYCDWVIALLKTMKLTMHSISNMFIEVEGDVAYGETYFWAYHRIKKDGEDYDFNLGGRYIDRFERRNGVWKIAKRRVAYDWNRYDPSTEEWGGLLAGDSIRGRRGPDDPVYQR